MILPPDTPFLLAFLILPAWIISKSKRLFRAFLLSSLLCWAISVAGVGFTSAIDPEYDSIAGVILLFAGWIPGMVYCGIWASVVSLGRWLDRRA